MSSTEHAVVHVKRPIRFDVSGARKRLRTEVQPERALSLDEVGPSSPELHGILSNTTLAEVAMPQRDVLTLEHNETIGEALRQLAKRGVLSAPLVMSPNLEDFSDAIEMDQSSKAPSLIGWMDVNDVLRGLLVHLEEKAPSKGMATTPAELAEELRRLGPEFMNRLVVTLAGGHDRSLLYTADLRRSIGSVIDSVFLGHVSEQSGPLGERISQPRVVHRAAVFDSAGDITHIVSQSDVIRFLRSRMPDMSEWASCKLRCVVFPYEEVPLDTGILAGRGVVAVEASHPAALALKLVHDSGHSAAAVVDDAGVLVGSISSADLRSLRAEDLAVLSLPCGLFLARLHEKDVAGFLPDDTPGGPRTETDAFFQSSRRLSSKEGVPASPQPHLDACSPDTTVGEVVERLAATHCTHVWVADGEGRLCGVVTPTDVLREASQASKAGEERFRMLKAIFEEQYAAVVEERDVATLSRLVGAMRGKVDEAS